MVPWMKAGTKKCLSENRSGMLWVGVQLVQLESDRAISSTSSRVPICVIFRLSVFNISRLAGAAMKSRFEECRPYCFYSYHYYFTLIYREWEYKLQ